MSERMIKQGGDSPEDKAISDPVKLALEAAIERAEAARREDGKK